MRVEDFDKSGVSDKLKRQKVCENNNRSDGQMSKLFPVVLTINRANETRSCEIVVMSEYFA
jgi:hypothetical protein